jgi:hypothetical protein
MMTLMMYTLRVSKAGGKQQVKRDRHDESAADLAGGSMKKVERRGEARVEWGANRSAPHHTKSKTEDREPVDEVVCHLL